MRIHRMELLREDGNVPIPGTDSFHDGPVWHHTDAVGLLGIVSRNAFWASSPLSLNDSSEILYGVDIFREAWSALSPQMSQKTQAFINEVLSETLVSTLSQSVYFLSATAQPDSLNQWQGYSGAQGYALEIGTDISLVPWEPNFSTSPWPEQPPAAFGLPLWVDVIYDKGEQLQLASEMITFLYEHVASDPVPLIRARQYTAMIVPQFKPEAFKQENEVRLIAAPKKSPENFRTGRRGLIPYIELVTAPETTEGPESTFGFSETRDRPLPLKSVMCGPVNEAERPGVVEAVRRLLAAHRYTDTDVLASKIPYRF